MKNIPTFLALCILLVLTGVFASPARADSPTIIENCTEGVFSSVLSTSNNIAFNCGGNHSTGQINFSHSYPINQAVTIDGDNNRVTFDGGHSTPLFVVNHSASLNLKNINLANGYGSSSNGGTLVNNGFMSLDHVTIRGASNSNYYGGAIFTTGAMDITNSTFLNNQAGSGGAIYATGSSANVTLANSVLHDNQVTTNLPNSNRGGAIYLDSGAQVQIFSSQIYSNTGRYGGAIANYSAALQLNNVSLSTNGYNQNPTAYGGGLDNEGTATANLTNVTFLNNALRQGDGGGIYNKGTATLNNVLLKGNSSTYGGGIANDTGTLNFTNGLVTGNVVNIAGGGGIANENGTMTLMNLTVSGNFATGDAGGVENGGGTATLTNVTLSGNSSDSGGGMANYRGTGTLTNVTIFGNRALHDGGGLGNYNFTNTHLHLRNVLIANNVVATSPNPTNNNCNFTLAPDTSDSNLSTDATCSFGVGRDNINAKLGILETNGGALVGVEQLPILTQRLLPPSPAIDDGTNTGCPPTDERNIDRYSGSACDVGAFEFFPCLTTTGKPVLISPAKGGVVTTSQVALDWAGPDCATKWNVVVRQGGKTGAVVFSRTKLKSSQVTISGLTKGKYFWQVTACAGRKCTAGPWWKFTRQ